MVSRVLTNRRKVKTPGFPTKMVKGKRRTEATRGCLTRSSAGSSSSAPAENMDGPKAAKDSRLDIPVTNGTGAKSKRMAVTAATNGCISKRAQAMANSGDVITNYFSPARSPVTADDAESLPDSTTNSSKVSSICNMDPHSPYLQHKIKTARLARTNSIEAPYNHLVSVSGIGAANSDEVETVSLVSSNDDLEEMVPSRQYLQSSGNSLRRPPPATVIDDSTTNPPPYKYHLHSRQQNQQHLSSVAAAGDASLTANAQRAFDGVAVDNFSIVDGAASHSYSSAAAVDGCVAGEGSDTDDDCVVIEDDDSDYNVPYQKTSKITNNFNGFTTSSTESTRSLRSVRCLKKHTLPATNCNNNSHLINNISDATVSSCITTTSSNTPQNSLLHCAAATNDFKEINDVCSSSSSSSSSCCSCCSSTRSICSENITACTLNICDSSSKVSARTDASPINSYSTRCKNDTVGGAAPLASLWRSPRKNEHPGALLSASLLTSGSTGANSSGLFALVQEKRDTMMVALAEEETKLPQHSSNEAVNSTFDHDDCLSSQEITTRGLRSSPSKPANHLHSSMRKSPSSSPSYSLRNCSNTVNVFKNSKRDHLSSASSADSSSNNSPVLVDLTSPRHSTQNSSYLSPKLSHSSPAVKQPFTGSHSRNTPLSPSLESSFSFPKTISGFSNNVSIEHSHSNGSSSIPQSQGSDKTVDGPNSSAPCSPATPSTPHKIQVLQEEDQTDELFLSSPTAATALSRLSVVTPEAKPPSRTRGRARGRGRKRLNVESVALDSEENINGRTDSSPPRPSLNPDPNEDSSSATTNGYSFRQSRTRSPFKANGFIVNAPSVLSDQQRGNKASNHKPLSPEKVNGIVKPPTRTSAKLQEQSNESSGNDILEGQSCRSKLTASAASNKNSRPARALRTTAENAEANSVNSRSSSAKDTSNKDSAPGGKNMQMTDYFPIRRSERKPKATLMYERQMDIERKIMEGSEEGLRVENFGEKGRGVVTTRLFRKGEFVVEYVGELLDMKDAKIREAKYVQDTSKGCYMYYFTFNDVQYCIDGTEETGYLGRLVNHSRTCNNLATKSVAVEGRPHLILVAKKDILPGTELLYDYGDRSKEALANHPWLAL